MDHRKPFSLQQEPWADRYGQHLGIRLTTNAVGWAIIEPTKGARIVASGRDYGLDGRHEDKAIEKWLEAGCPERVELYKYASFAAYRRSVDKEGMSSRRP